MIEGEDKGNFGGFSISPLTEEDIMIDVSDLNSEQNLPDNAGKNVVDEIKKDIIQDPDIVDMDDVLNDDDDIGSEKSTKPSEKKDTEKASSSPSSSTSDDLYKAFAENLVSEGFFENFTDDEWMDLVKESGSSAGALKALKAKEAEKIEKQYIDSLSEEDKEIYQGKKTGASLDELGLLNRRISELSKITEETLEDNIELQENIVSTFLIENTSSDKETIQDLIETYKDKGKLKDNSLECLKKLNKKASEKKQELFEKAKATEESRKQEYLSSLKNLETKAKSIKEFVSGVELKDAEKESIYKDLTVPVYKDKEGNEYNAVTYNRSKNPDLFDLALAYYNRIGLFNFDKNGNLTPNISKLTRVVKNKEVKDKFDRLLESSPVRKGNVNTRSLGENKPSSLGNEFLY